MCYIEHHCTEFPLGSSCDIIVFLRRNIVFYLHDVLVKIGTEVFLGWGTKHSVSSSILATLHFASLATLQSALHSPCPPLPLPSCLLALPCLCYPAICCPAPYCLHHLVFCCPAILVVHSALCPAPPLPCVQLPLLCPCAAPGAPVPMLHLGLCCSWLCEARHTFSVVGRRRQGFCRTQGKWQGCMVEWQEWWGNWVEEYRVAKRAEMREMGGMEVHLVVVKTEWILITWLQGCCNDHNFEDWA